MTHARTAIQDFATSNKIYANAEVSFWEIDSLGAKSETLATLYADLTSDNEVSNPQILDSFGKFAEPVYIDTPVIAEITALGNTPGHDTGVIRPGRVFEGAGSPEGVLAATVGTLYVRTDGGAGTTLYVKESGGSTNLGWVGK